MRIALDAMGGDHAPREIVRGAVEGLEFLGPEDRLVLIGVRDAVQAELGAAGANDARLVIEHASQIIGMDDIPVEALKQKRDSSIVRMATMAAEKKVDAVISAGNTGACVAACQLRMRTLEGVSRPGIAVVIPSFHGPIVICDVGANIAPKPFHLLQYAQMSAAYAQSMFHVERPRIGLLSIGEEEVKGNLLVKEARRLIKEDARLNYIGNVEGRDLFRDIVDVVVCDGFVGNVVLKLTEGLAEGLMKTIAAEVARESRDLAPRFKPIIEAIWARHDYAEYGGAPLLGVDGICIICHGSSSARAIKNAVRVARDCIVRRFNDELGRKLTRAPDA